VGLGSTVVVDSAEGEETFTIVGSSEARPGEGRISNTSPLGRALLGRRQGDDVVVRAPAGERHYRIQELR
jgi:transcription elongation factor GreA